MNKIKYFIWSGNELLGTVDELNLRTALQKAELIAKYNGKSSWTVKHNDSIIANGKVQTKQFNRISKISEIIEILTMRKAN